MADQGNNSGSSGKAGKSPRKHRIARREASRRRTARGPEAGATPQGELSQADVEAKNEANQAKENAAEHRARVHENRRRKTLDRILVQAGLGSRRDVAEWIRSGRVAVEGKLVREPDIWLDPERARISLDGKPLQNAEMTYLLLYKPKGTLTTAEDPDGRPTVYDLLGPGDRRVLYAGRLDMDTTGLLLLSNDTAFIDRVTNPESHVPKTYLVKASKLLSDEQLAQLANGLMLSDGPTRPAVVKRVRDSKKYTFLEITLTEGRNRQVRRMVEELDAHVLKLVRTQIGSIAIDGMPIGSYRPLSAEEVGMLAGAVKE